MYFKKKIRLMKNCFPSNFSGGFIWSRWLCPLWCRVCSDGELWELRPTGHGVWNRLFVLCIQWQEEYPGYPILAISQMFCFPFPKYPVFSSWLVRTEHKPQKMCVIWYRLQHSLSFADIADIHIPREVTEKWTFPWHP